MMRETHGKIEDVWMSARIEDSRVTIEADDDSGAIYVKGRENSPLSTTEDHAELTITGEGTRTDITLDAKQLDELADAIYHLQQPYNE